MFGDDLPCGGLDTGRVGDIDRDGVQPGVLRTDTVEEFGAPPADDDGVARVVQTGRKCQADPAGRSGDEDGVSGEVHVIESRIRRASHPERNHRGITDPWQRGTDAVILA